jgi:hypothetical protein
MPQLPSEKTFWIFLSEEAYISVPLQCLIPTQLLMKLFYPRVMLLKFLKSTNFGYSGIRLVNRATLQLCETLSFKNPEPASHFSLTPKATKLCKVFE